MPDLMNKQQLAQAAKSLAESYELVQLRSTTFIPVDWQTLSPAPTPKPEDSIWLPMEREDKQQLAHEVSGILFANDGELRSFDFMLGQLASQHRDNVNGIFIKTQAGLKVLNNRGLLVDPTGDFMPNYVRPMLNTNEADRDLVWNTLVEWLEDEATAHSLLAHLATSLAPNFSAVKYLLLLGEGRNGKGVLLAMLAALFGKENVSSVTRQMMAERSPSVTELNNQLINIVYDGEMTYLKDSSMEKTLVAGEPAAVRKLYESGTTIVQTNALFVEALNLEPKNRDKSPALQKRLARFRFPKIYRQDLAFHRQMVSEPMLGAFLSLLIDHYVREEEVAEALTLTRASMELQLDQVFLGSPILQYLEQLAATDPVALKRVEDGNMPVDTFLNSFKPWAQAQGMQERGDGDLLALMRTTFDIGWKTVRVNKVPTSRRTIKALRPEALMTLDQLKGPSNGKDESTQELGAGEADPDGTDGATQGSPQA